MGTKKAAWIHFNLCELYGISEFSQSSFMKMHLHQENKDFTPLVFKNRASYGNFYKDWEKSNRNSWGSYSAIQKSS